MSDIKFDCPGCGQHLSAGPEARGQPITCPSCQAQIMVPATTESTLRIAPKERYEGSPPDGGPGGPSGRFCVNCGKPVAPAAVFCGACGSPTGQDHLGTSGRTGSPRPDSHSLPESAAGALCYVGGWVTGLIFLLIDKRPFVRFHAAQAIVAFLGLMILRYVLLFFTGGVFAVAMPPAFHPPTPGIVPSPMNFQPPDMTWLHVMGFLGSASWLAILITWVFCIINAARGEWFHLPIAGEIAEGIAKSK